MVYSGSAGLGFYVSKGFFDTIPKALDEAAIVDGATKWDVFSKIIMPLSKPIIVSTIMTSFMAPWLDFIFAKVIAGADPRYYTVAIGLYTMLTKENIVNWYTCLRSWRSLRFHPDRYSVPVFAEILCRGHVRSS